MPALAHASPAYPREYDYFADYGINNRHGVVATASVKPIPELTTSLQYLWYETQADLAFERLYAYQWQNPSQAVDAPWRTSHKIVASASLHFAAKQGPVLGSIYPLENTRLDLIFRYWSGQRYTLAQSSGEIFINSPLFYVPGGPSDGERIDDQWTIDLSFRRSIMVGRGFTVDAIALVKNLTDNENIAAVWLTSGEPNTTGFLDTPSGQQFIQQYGADIYELKENDPMNYAPPRQVYFGLGMRF